MLNVNMDLVLHPRLRYSVCTLSGYKYNRCFRVAFAPYFARRVIFLAAQNVVSFLPSWSNVKNAEA
jgi:hypothetical protein